MEGASEDIELTMNDGNQIMAQAKGVVKGSSDFSHVRSKLSDAIRTLSSADNSSVEQLILITNSKNPLKEDTSNQFRYNSSNKQRQRDYAQRCIISLFNLSAPLLSPTFKEYVPANYFKKFPKAMSIVFPWQAMRRNTPSLWLA